MTAHGEERVDDHGGQLTLRRGATIAARATLSRDPSGWALRPDGAGPAHAPLLRHALEKIARGGGGHLTMWASPASEASDQLAAACGLLPDRDLLQLRIALPPSEQAGAIALRPFVPGRDEDAWLAVNNRAFAWHPEQGGWDRAVLEEREAEPWFDPAGFLLHEEQGRLAGFCWTKVHADHAPPLGEIYVIAVDPDFAGRGLGKALTLAGLHHLARHVQVGMLYVDGTNAPARRLYDALGFQLDHIDRSYVLQVAPESPTSAPMP